MSQLYRIGPALSVHVKQWRLTKNENDKCDHLCCPEMEEEDWKQHIYRHLSLTADEEETNMTMKCAVHFIFHMKKTVLHKEGNRTTTTKL